MFRALNLANKRGNNMNLDILKLNELVVFTLSVRTFWSESSGTCRRFWWALINQGPMCPLTIRDLNLKKTSGCI